jgi:hypothetical protein
MLNDKEKTDVIYYLGYPGKVLIPTSTHYQNTINDRLNNLTADIEARVRELLRKLAKVDKQLEEAACRFSTLQVDDIRINPEERRLLSLERKRLLRELSSLIDIPQISGSSDSMFSVVI